MRLHWWIVGASVSLLGVGVDAHAETRATRSTEAVPYAFHRPLTVGAIRIYQLTFSRARVVGCPMHPHCSEYGRQALERLDLLHAGLATADRLLRCGHDLDRYPLVRVGGRLAFADPVVTVSGSSSPSQRLGDPLPDAIRGDADVTSQPTPTPSLAPPTLEEPPPVLPAQHPALGVAETDAQLLRFADGLRAERRFDAAQIEYERLLVYFPASALAAAARRGILECHLGAGRFDAAIDWGERLLADPTLAQAARAEIALRVGVGELRGGDPVTAQERFEALAAAAPEPRLSEQGLLLGGIALARQRRWREAAATFSRLDPASPFSGAAQDMTSVAQGAQQKRRKSPALAAALGVVPGLGYLYSGYRGSAASAFIVNGLFMWATAEAARRHNHGLTATLGVFSSGWYVGSIYGSAVSARRVNDAAERRLIEALDPGFDY